MDFTVVPETAPAAELRRADNKPLACIWSFHVTLGVYITDDIYLIGGSCWALGLSAGEGGGPSGDESVPNPAVMLQSFV